MGQHFVSILYIYIIYKQKDPELISGPLYVYYMFQQKR